MDEVRELLERENFSGALIIQHGFTDYMRDYEVIVVVRYGPPFDDVHRYQFVGCVEANTRSAVAPAVFGQSIGDGFVYAGPNYPDNRAPDGFVWGLRFSTSHWGMIPVEESALATSWSKSTMLRMNEVRIDTEAFHIQLVCSELRYEFVGRDSSLLGTTKNYPIKSK